MGPPVFPLRVHQEGPWARCTVIGIVLIFMALFVALPIAYIFVQAFAKGWGMYWDSIKDPVALSAIGLTIRAAAIAVPLNLIFGVCAAWAIAKFEFLGKNFLITFLDLPLTVSPVIAGLIYVLIFGLQGWLGPWLSAHHVKIIFATPGIVMATIFVTFPFVARELIPLMQKEGREGEEAAVLLGAGFWGTFRRVTWPNIKWGVLYGVMLSVARAFGEFGAVSVVSGHIRGQTNTMTLHIEQLYSEYNFTAAFAIASLLTLLAFATLVVKIFMERRSGSPQ
ncbi:MAG: sulfate ABC transporter permease subunit CysW [Elusimicrobia bacterium]|nr:sulfate ABC transporter permease subunit CysW [Candidatus Obscuribacterium magneticum]